MELDATNMAEFHSNATLQDDNNLGDQQTTGAWLDEHFPLHKAIFQNDIKLLAKTLREEPDIDVDIQDTHGNTALHLAVMLGNKGFF